MEAASDKPVIIVCEGLEKTPFDWLRQNASVLEISWKERDKLLGAIKDADGLIVRTYTRVDEELLAHATRLKVVARGGVGLENIDQAACKRCGIKVLYTPTANTRAVCEYVFNVIFALTRPLVILKEPIAEETFHAYRRNVKGLELSGKTMGILGMGNIGRGVGKIAWAMQMEVLYNDLIDVSARLDYPAKSLSKTELYERADILTIHVNHQPDNLNYRMINAAVFSKMKPTAILINTSRGEVVDAADLAEALKTHRIAGAAIDVHDPEPIAPDYPLWPSNGCPNILITPHLAARTQGAMDAMSWVARDVVEYLRGGGKPEI